jgi:hypothetical protein
MAAVGAKTRERRHGSGKRLPHGSRQSLAALARYGAIGALCVDLNALAQLVQHLWAV